MTLSLTATTDIDDLVIDFIEVQLRSGKQVSLNWDKSWMERSDGKFIALYDGVCFGTKSAAGKIYELNGMRVISVGLYSESKGEGDYPISINKMEFYDGSVQTEFCNVFAQVGTASIHSPAMQQMYNKFLASSRR